MGCGSSTQANTPAAGQKPSATQDQSSGSAAEIICRDNNPVGDAPDPSAPSYSTLTALEAVRKDKQGSKQSLRDTILNTNLDIAKAFAENIGVTLLECAAVLPPLAPIAHCMGTLASLCKQAYILKQDCQSFHDLLAGVEQIMVEVYAAKPGSKTEEDLSTSFLQRDKELIARLQDIFDRAASLLRELVPKSEGSKPSFSRASSKSLAQYFKSLVLNSSNRLVLSNLRDDLEAIIQQFLLQSSLGAERKSTLTAVFAETKFAQEEALRSRIEASGGIDKCIEADGTIKQEILEKLTESDSLLSQQAQIHHQELQAKLEESERRDREQSANLKRQEEKLDRLLGMMSSRPDFQSLQPVSQSTLQANFQRLPPGLARQPLESLGFNPLTPTPEAVMIMQLSSQIEILQSQVHRMCLALQSPLSSARIAHTLLPLGNAEADRAMTTNFFRIDDLRNSPCPTTVKAAVEEYCERFGATTHLCGVTMVLMGEKTRSHWGTVCVRRFLGLGPGADGWLPGEITRENEPFVAVAKDLFPLNRDAASVTNCVGDGAPNWKEGQNKLTDPKRKEEVTQAWSGRFLSFDPLANGGPAKFSHIRHFSIGCQTTIASNLPCAIGDISAQLSGPLRFPDFMQSIATPQELGEYEYVACCSEAWEQDPRLSTETTSSEYRMVMHQLANMFGKGVPNAFYTAITCPIRLPHWLDVHQSSPNPRFVAVGTICLYLSEKDPDVLAHMLKEEARIEDMVSEAIQREALGKVIACPSAAGSQGWRLGVNAMESISESSFRGLEYNQSLGMVTSSIDPFFGQFAGDHGRAMAGQFQSTLTSLLAQ